MSLPYFLDGFALSQYESGIEMVAPEEGGVSSWPEAVQYLLKNYAQNQHISNAITDLRDTRQYADEDEREFSTRLNSAVNRCGNVHSQFEVITLFVDGLHSSIRPLVARYREADNHTSYEDVGSFALSEGNALRAREGNILPSVGKSSKKNKSSRKTGKTDERRRHKLLALRDRAESS